MWGASSVDIIPTNISETAELSGSGNFGEYRIDFCWQAKQLWQL